MLVPVSTRTTNVCSIGFFYVYIVVYWEQFCVNISLCLYFVCVLSWLLLVKLSVLANISCLC